jgi:hypothetical protein
MTPNDSLTLSCRIQELMRKDILQFMEPLFPKDVVKAYELENGDKKKRDRVYTGENTLMTMIVTAVMDDKSLQNSVGIFQEVFKRNCKFVIDQEQDRVEKLRLQAQQDEVSRVGRPCEFKIKFPKSKTKDISSNTAAYSKARGRIDLALIDKVFKGTAADTGIASVKPWHGRIAYNTDGTYIQMQDTKEIPEKYRAQKTKSGELQGYPQGLLQVLTQHGSGLIKAYTLAGRTESELKVAVDLVNQLPSKSLLLADDLYNCYAFMSHAAERGIDIIVPEKKDRKFNSLRPLDVGDEIVELTKPKNIQPLYEGQILPEKIVVRRIVYHDTQDPEITHVLLTTILEESIGKMEIVLKYTSNIARSKTEEMVFKEYGVALSAYNLLRRIVAQSANEADISPQRDIFQKLFAPYKNSLVDRKGRVYSRWAPGRPSAHNRKSVPTSNTIQARSSLPTKNEGR